MKISQEEIDAANYALGELMEAPFDEAVMEHALIAALKVRRARKQAKRKDKFKPCAIQYDEKDATEIMLSDEPAVWYDAKSHVEIAYNFDGLMIGVRLWNVAAKRERQRKEKDKQVVESAAKRENAMSALAEACGDELVSKAPEWDGTFGEGKAYQMRNGHKAYVRETRLNELVGDISGVTVTWPQNGKYLNPNAHDLIRPWPKGEQ